MNQNLILLAEDNSDEAALTIRAFKKAGLTQQLLIVKDGQEAVDYLLGKGSYEGRNTTFMPDMVLLDVHMPRLSGLDTLMKIRADKGTYFLPVIMLSTSGMEVDIKRSYELCANSYVQKPIDFELFVSMLRQIVLYWLEINKSYKGAT